MAPLLLVAGLVAFAGGVAVLLTYGPRYRVARLLATTRPVSVAEALGLARSGERRYVRVDGRIDADDEFEDPDHRPLVLRRVRLEVRDRGRWRAVVDDRRTVPFRVRQGTDEIDVDGEALDAGLVVIPRVSVGVAGELPEHVPADVAADRPVRLRIEQLSSVEHAAVLGCPTPGPSGRPTMTAGLGRPLVVTPLETAEAIRVIGEGRGRPASAGALMAFGLVLLVSAAGWTLLDAVR